MIGQSPRWRLAFAALCLLYLIRESASQVQKCTAYSASSTNNALTKVATCTFTACPGVSYTISMCGNGGSCSGDSYLRLLDSSNTLVASNNDFCGKCSQFTYSFTQGSCAVHTIREGCSSNTACSGTVAIITTTSSPTPIPTTDPTVDPTVVPTVVPTTLPSVLPTFVPTTVPSEIPTAMPSSVEQRALESPTWGVRSGYSFAAVTSAGAAVLWGRLTISDDPLVTDRSTKATVVIPSGVTDIVASRTAYVALLANGRYHAWGAQDVSVGGSQGANIVTTGTPTETSVQPTTFVASEAAFAGLNYRGSVVAFGAWGHGGNVTAETALYGYADGLTQQVREIIPAAGAFAALTWYRTVYTWGSPMLGAGVSSLTMPALVDVYKVYATRSSFAALLHSGRVIAWGDRYAGGNLTAVAQHVESGVYHIIASQSVFVAFKNDGGLVSWGNPQYGAGYIYTPTAPSTAVAFVAHTATAFAAVLANGNVTTWGVPGRGGDAASVQAQLVGINAIYGNSFAFAAVNQAGGVVAWGDRANGGLIPSSLRATLSSGVISVHSTQKAFAALKSDGSVVVWGNAYFGGEATAAGPYLTSGVAAICANDVAFTAILEDGRAVVWGHTSSVPYAGLLINAPSLKDVKACA